MFPLPLFHVFGFPVYAYGLTAAFSLIAGYLVTHRLFKKHGLDVEKLPDLTCWIIVGGILGARALFILEHFPEYASAPLKMLAFQEGGLVQFGGIAAGILAGMIYCRRQKVSFAVFSDAVAPGLCLGLALSRLGCFAAGCCFGSPTSMPWGVEFSHIASAAFPKDVPLHPTQLYSLGLELCVFFILVNRKPGRPGDIFWLYLCLTAFARLFTDMFRGAVTPAHFFILLGMAIPAILLLTISQIKKGGNMKFQSIVKLGLLVFAATALTACGLITTQKITRGLDIPGSKVNAIVKNQTTEKDLIRMFGAPLKYRETAEGKEFFYEYAKSGGVRWNLLFSFGGGTQIKTLYVWMDKNGVVTDYAYNKS